MASSEGAAVKVEMLTDGRDGGIDWAAYGAVTDEVLEEIESAILKFPWWPEDCLHASAIVGKESGELTQAALNFVYHGGDPEHMRMEAIQTAAMAIRFLRHFDRLTGHRVDLIREGGR